MGHKSEIFDMDALIMVAELFRQMLNLCGHRNETSVEVCPGLSLANKGLPTSGKPENISSHAHTCLICITDIRNTLVD